MFWWLPKGTCASTLPGLSSSGMPQCGVVQSCSAEGRAQEHLRCMTKCLMLVLATHCIQFTTMLRQLQIEAWADEHGSFTRMLGLEASNPTESGTGSHRCVLSPLCQLSVSALMVFTCQMPSGHGVCSYRAHPKVTSGCRHHEPYRHAMYAMLGFLPQATNCISPL